MTNEIKAIIFDLDGTLLDTGDDIASSVNHTLQHFGYKTLDTGMIIDFVGDGLEAVLNRVIGFSVHRDADYPIDEDRITEAMKVFQNHYKDHCLDKTIPYPNVIETLESLTHLPMIVVSNKPEDFCKYMLKQLGMDKYFMRIFGSDSFEKKKPHPLPLLESIKIMGEKAENTLMVGDTDKDIRSGKAAGTQTCAALYGMRDPEELLGYNADFNIEKFEDLIKIID